MAKSYQNIVKKQASSLEGACVCLKKTLGDAQWLKKLEDAASDIRKRCKGDDWVIDITDMEIPIETPRHLKPKTLKDNLKLFVSIKMQGCGKSWAERKNCITSLGFKVTIVEKSRKDPSKLFHTGFHIDRTDDTDDSSEMHPLYHVHFLNESVIDGTEALGMDVPRLMHHPVDVLLGILLVFANYNQTGYKKLLEDGYFMSLCRESANHILAPYFASLSLARWGTSPNGVFDIELCPYLIQ